MKNKSIFLLLTLWAVWSCKNAPITPTAPNPPAQTVALDYNNVSKDFDYKLVRLPNNLLNLSTAFKIQQSIEIVADFNNFSDTLKTYSLLKSGLEQNTPYAFVFFVLGGDAVIGNYQLDSTLNNFIRITAHDVQQKILTADIDATFVSSYTFQNPGFTYPGVVHLQKNACKLSYNE